MELVFGNQVTTTLVYVDQNSQVNHFLLNILSKNQECIDLTLFFFLHKDQHARRHLTRALAHRVQRVQLVFLQTTDLAASAHQERKDSFVTNVIQLFLNMITFF